MSQPIEIIALTRQPRDIRRFFRLAHSIYDGDPHWVAPLLMDMQKVFGDGNPQALIMLIGEGIKNRQIAARLYISEATVRHHLTSVFAKLGVADRFELVIYAFQHGLAKLPQ